MRDHFCKFCKKGFSSEKILSSHMCVKKKRWAEKDTIGARLGFRVFQQFYALTTKTKKPKTEEDFIESKFYIDFVKFGRYLVELDPIYADRFIDFIIKNGVKMKDWREEYVYIAYLEEMMKSESSEMAVERTINEMQEWSKENGFEYKDFFRKISAVEATFKIRSGRISPWVLYLSESGGELLERMNEEQGKIIHKVIDPAKWQIKFMLHKDDVGFISDILKDAGI